MSKDIYAKVSKEFLQHILKPGLRVKIKSLYLVVYYYNKGTNLFTTESKRGRKWFATDQFSVHTDDITDHFRTPIKDCVIGYRTTKDLPKTFGKIKPIYWEKDEDVKLDWTLLPYEAIEEAISIMNFGTSKGYDRDSWKKETLQKQLQSAQRHLAELIKGSLIDSESGRTHAAHLVCRALFATAKIINGED